LASTGSDRPQFGAKLLIDIDVFDIELPETDPDTPR
jgi:hypothetical protein